MSDPGSQKAEIELPAETEIETATEPARGRRRRRGSVGAESSVNMDELRELIQLINENDFTEFELEREGFRVQNVTRHLGGGIALHVARRNT